jgi:hypothetical protein
MRPQVSRHAIRQGRHADIGITLLEVLEGARCVTRLQS